MKERTFRYFSRKLKSIHLLSKNCVQMRLMSLVVFFAWYVLLISPLRLTQMIYQMMQLAPDPAVFACDNGPLLLWPLWRRLLRPPLLSVRCSFSVSNRFVFVRKTVFFNQSITRRRRVCVCCLRFFFLAVRMLTMLTNRTKNVLSAVSCVANGSTRCYTIHKKGSHT